MARGLEHVRGCELCRARGHLCTLCTEDTVIYPFMVSEHRTGENMEHSYNNVTGGCARVR